MTFSSSTATTHLGADSERNIVLSEWHRRLNCTALGCDLPGSRLPKFSRIYRSRYTVPIDSTNGDSHAAWTAETWTARELLPRHHDAAVGMTLKRAGQRKT